MALPTPSEIAREIPVLAVEAGGSIELAEVNHRLTRTFWNQISGVDNGVEYLERAIEDAIGITLRNGIINTSGTLLIASQKGWEQAALLKGEREHDNKGRVGVDRTPQTTERTSNGIKRFSVGHESFPATTTGASLARAAIAEATRQNGGEPPRLRNGLPLAYPPLRKDGYEYSENAWRMIERESMVQEMIIVELEDGTECSLTDVLGRMNLGSAGGAASPSRRGRKQGASWPRIICEVIAGAGGHANWPAIDEAAGKRPEAADNAAWREEALQALRNHTAPLGRAYFSAAELNDGVSFALTEAGRKLANKRTQDDRAPTLTRYLAEAIDPNGNGRLTDMELYALLFLATQLGMTAESNTIYHKLPRDFPDEERYSMIPFWIEQSHSPRVEDD